MTRTGREGDHLVESRSKNRMLEDKNVKRTGTDELVGSGSESMVGEEKNLKGQVSNHGMKKKVRLNSLRKKFAAHILLSDANVLKQKVMVEALGKQV
ncbi:hypothetical protein L1987_57890 [Smallanthus sonchifolius]|uniref:Uncharacterized protein n=1 Tax=Smallanthus sonchifolius TaxID=185202 RepID=A0ACB9DE20_9ASTR|nr:hypothetical protein L1987_57890 [Smallanthus sonchifolius]